MFSRLLSKRKVNECNVTDEIDVKSLISKITTALKGKNEDDVLFQRSDKIIYFNILYPNRITIENLKSVYKIENINEIVLQKNNKKKAITLIVLLETSKRLKKNIQLDQCLQLHEERSISSKIKQKVYLTDDKILLSDIFNDKTFENKKSIIFDYFKNSIRICLIEENI